MLLLLIVASVPVIGISGTNAVIGYEAQLASGRRTASLLLEVAAERHGAIIASMRDMLNGIARSPALIDAAAGQCGDRLAGVLGIFRQQYSNIFMLDGQGRLLCSALPTLQVGDSFADLNVFILAKIEAARPAAPAALPGQAPPAQATPAPAAPPAVAPIPVAPTQASPAQIAPLAVMAPPAPASFVLDRFGTMPLPGQTARTAHPILAAAVPILRDGKLDRVLVAGLLTDVFIRAESTSRVDAAQRVWLVDRDNAPLALTQARQDELPTSDMLNQLVSRSQASGMETVARDGRDFAYSISALDQGLRLMVGLPTGEIRTAANAMLLRRGVELAAFLLACLVVIVVGADIAIARPLRQLAWRVRQWRPGATFSGRHLRGEPEEVRSLERAFEDAAIAIAAREDELRAALRQRDLLMAEIHHRVKNNLQIVASLLNLQARRLRDPAARAEFGTARDRVQALATLHRHLYTNRTFEAIMLRSFLEELCQQLFSALGEVPGRRIKLVLEAGELEIVTDQAVSLALLVTEAVTNSIKHAFPDGRTGTITIAVRLENRPTGKGDPDAAEAGTTGEPGEDEPGKEVVLTIRDDGQGMVEDDAREHGIGMTLIKGFAQHLGGEIVQTSLPVAGATSENPAESGGKPDGAPAADGGTELTVRFLLQRRGSDISGRPMGTPSTN
jgi:two-component sensor histidine kinase